MRIQLLDKAGQLLGYLDTTESAAVIQQLLMRPGVRLGQVVEPTKPKTRTKSTKNVDPVADDPS